MKRIIDMRAIGIHIAGRSMMMREETAVTVAGVAVTGVAVAVVVVVVGLVFETGPGTGSAIGSPVDESVIGEETTG
jgi:hypothetical protein